MRIPRFLWIKFLKWDHFKNFAIFISLHKLCHLHLSPDHDWLWKKRSSPRGLRRTPARHDRPRSRRHHPRRLSRTFDWSWLTFEKTSSSTWTRQLDYRLIMIDLGLNVHVDYAERCLVINDLGEDVKVHVDHADENISSLAMWWTAYST